MTTNDQPRCANCEYFKPNSAIIIGQSAGKCAWLPPPIIAQLYAMLMAEPATQINYDAVFNDLPDAMRFGRCSQWIRKGTSPAVPANFTNVTEDQPK